MGKKVNYSYSLITYLDVLGFRDLVEHKTAGQISQIIRILKETTKQDKDVSKEHEMGFFNFSDTTIRIAPLYTKTNLERPSGHLFWEILGLVHVQFELALQNIIVRGAVAAGDIVKSWGVLYGPGLVRAYELEQKASYPRIIIDPKLFEELKINPALRAHSYKEELNYIKNLVSKDADDFWFVDYLKGIQNEMDFPEEGYPQFLYHHADLIKEGLVRHRLNKNVTRKFKWLKNYHNSTVKNTGTKRSSGLTGQILNIGTVVVG